MIAKWEGPFPLVSATVGNMPGTLKALPEEGGVYIWVVRDPSRRRICYIGSAKSNIRQRQYDHLIRSLGGQFSLPQLPIGDKVEWLIPPPSKGQSTWEAAYERLALYIHGFPDLALKTLKYLESIDVFAFRTSNAYREIEYLLQTDFIELRKRGDHRADLLEEGLKGSRQRDRTVTLEGHDPLCQ